MIKKDLDSLASLGRSLTTARDSGIVTPSQFAPAAGALAAAMLTGSIEMEAYAGIHWVLGQMLEAAFSNRFKGKDEELGKHLETVGRMWSRVGPDGGPLAGVNRFFSKSFDLEKARFDKNPPFSAPLRSTPEEISKMLRAAGISAVSKFGGQAPEPTCGALCEENAAKGKKGLIIAWGERRMALVFME